MEVKSNPVHLITLWLAKNVYVMAFFDTAVILGPAANLSRTAQIDNERVSQLTARIFAQSATFEEAKILRGYYMELLLFLGIIAFLVFVLPAWFLSAVLEYLYGTYMESLPLSFVFGGVAWGSAFAMDVLILFIVQYMRPPFLSRRVWWLDLLFHILESYGGILH
jgi:hypothetical protein